MVELGVMREEISDRNLREPLNANLLCEKINANCEI